MNNKPLKIRLYMPDSNGGYTLWQELTAEQQAQWRQKLTGRMGAALGDWFRQHPGEITAVP